MLGLRKYICSQFKPNAAKALYDYFNVKNVLDFSMGWGDRLAGFYASMNTELYVGIDPRKENHPIYEQQARYYDSHLTFFENEKKPNFIVMLLRTLIMMIMRIPLISFLHHHLISMWRDIVMMILRVG